MPYPKGRPFSEEHKEAIRRGLRESSKNRKRASKEKTEGRPDLKGNRLAWRGGRHITDQGYVAIYEPTHPNAKKIGYVMEHRKVMADFLGRKLERWETVHHKNGNKQDNRLENLELRTGQHGNGAAVVDIVADLIAKVKTCKPLITDEMREELRGLLDVC